MAIKNANEYFENLVEWKSELQDLRLVISKTELKEEVKWGRPCYTYNGKPVIGISGFKNHYGLWFFQGKFLSDSQNLLMNAQEGKTKAMRQMRFSQDVTPDLEVVSSYVDEAIDNAKQGKFEKSAQRKLQIPNELKHLFDEEPEVKLAFDKFNRSDKVDFANYISEAKRSSTKETRLVKIKPMILKGESLNMRYRKK